MLNFFTAKCSTFDAKAVQNGKTRLLYYTKDDKRQRWMTLQIYKRFFISQSSLLSAFKDSKCSNNFFSFCFRDCAVSKSSFSTASAFFARMASSSFCTTSGSSENFSAALLLPVLLLLVSFFLAFAH